MNVVDLLRGYHGAAGVIRPLNLETDAEIYGTIENYEVCKKKIENSGGSADNIYVTDASCNNIYYIEPENGVYLELFPFSVDYLNMVNFKQRLAMTREKQQEYLSEHEYRLYYYTIPDAMKIYDFEKRYLTIPQDKLTEVWLSVYTDVDYGFSAWNKDVINYVLKYAAPHNKTGYYTIYRGEGTTSTPIEDSYSWTTDVNIALWFAAMWEGKRVWKANVKAENIAFFIDNRNEKEVIVAPENIENLEDMEIYSGERDNMMDFLYNVLDDYKKYGELIPEAYANSRSNDLHGMNHTARVLINSLLIAQEMGCLEDNELELLSFAAIFHDCGRLSDDIETGHGERSSKIMLKSDIVKDRFDDEELELLSAVITCHDMPDEKGYDFIESHISIFYQDAAKIIYDILKDADALDRYRLCGYRYEFDFNYLRLEESKRLPLVTAALFKGKVEELVLKQQTD